MTTTIGPHTRITGRITGDADLLVEGAVDGHIELNSNLVIAASGSISGHVRAVSVRIEGRLNGILEASHVHLTNTARVVAEQLTTGLLQMDDGACVKGEVVMSLEGTVAAVPTKASPAQKPAARPATSFPARTATPVAAPVNTATAVPVSRPTIAATATAVVPKTTTVVVEEVVEESEAEVEAQAGETIQNVPATEYDSMTVKELRDRLRELDLPLSGTKQELAERLAEAES
jgi:cytoskeletal protein CcmA (bactofilin family)